MIILGIETSCDETGVCILEAEKNQIQVLGNQLYSQVSKHQEYGGVMPMLAKREHAKNLVPLLEKCLEEAEYNRPVHQNGHPSSTEEGETFQTSSLVKEECQSADKAVDQFKLSEVEKILSREPELFVELKKLLETVEKPSIDAIAVTNGPGLEPALWVGVTFAKALAIAWDIPIIPTNHMEGHIVVASLIKLKANKYQLTTINYPSLALLISGGHTQLVLIKENPPIGKTYEIIGNTCDDALGEAYDKVARMLNLPYPGGKIISELAEKERREFPNKKPPYPLPRPMINSKDLNFSFSGLKTAVLYTLKKIPEITDQIKQEISLEFEKAILDVLSNKVSKAIEQYNPQTLIIGGGVSANLKIRETLKNICQKYNIEFLVPEISASTDNALMIALAGYINILSGKKAIVDFKADGNLSL